MDDKSIIEQYASLPKQLRQQAADFILFLKQKQESAPVQQNTSSNKPKFGSHQDLFVISEDFDEPLEDFKDYMP